MIASQVSIGQCQAEIERQLGFRLSADQAIHLDRLVHERARRSKSEPALYVTQMLLGGSDRELLSLAAEFTVGESFFFRDMAQLHLCCEAIVESARDGRKVRVLSAGCSTGEEPYSLLMLLSERLPLERIDMVALDISSGSIQRAQRATYSAWQLRETPERLKARWFAVQGREYCLAPDITQRVKFVQGSLAVTSTLLPEPFDVVLCRNVLMYFSSEQYRLAVQRLMGAMAEGGYLFLGHAENIRGLGLELELVHRADSFCYRKPDGRTVVEPQSVIEPGASLFGDNLLRRLVLSASSAPEQRAEAVPELAVDEMSSVHRVTTPLAVLPQPTMSSTSELGALRDVNALLGLERYAAALDLLDQQGGGSPAVRLGRAMLHVYTNQFTRARELALELVDDLNVAAGAHYVLTLCYEYSGEWQAASYHAQRAAYLDPTFAMPRLHLGILSRRQGERLAARRELLQARALLRVELSERLLWFGGGCSRATLLQACERELAATGGRT